MNQRTPGNWQASNPQNKPGSLLYTHEVSERGALVATCYGDSPEEAKANAEACAAAPELKALLQIHPEFPDDWHAHNPDAINAHAEALKDWEKRVRALLVTLPQ